MNDLILIARLIIGCVFSYAGLRKITDLESFYRSILSFELIPPLWGRILSRLLPGIELLMGIVVCLGIGVPVGAISILIMLIGFSIALTLAHLHHRVVDCGCLGASEAPTSYGRVLLRNVVLVLLTCLTAFGGMHQPFLWQLLTSQNILMLLTAIGSITAFSLGIMIWDIFHLKVIL